MDAVKGSAATASSGERQAEKTGNRHRGNAACALTEYLLEVPLVLGRADLDDGVADRRHRNAAFRNACCLRKATPQAAVAEK